MRIIVQSKNVALTAALRRYVQRQAAKLSGPHLQIRQVTAFLETIARKKNDLGGASVKLLVEVPGKDVVVERHGVDLYDTIVDAADRARRALRKRKERLLNHRTS